MTPFLPKNYRILSINWIQNMKEITDEEYALFRKLTKIWFHTQPTKSGSFFICGESGEKDAHGLPEIILVCPHPGINTTAIYRKEKVGRSGQ
jgi:hypothetical protein